MRKKSFITWLLITGFLILSASNHYQTGSASLSITGGTPSPGETLNSTVNVTIPSGTLLGAATIDIQYDPTVVDALACSVDPSGAFDSKVCNPNFINTGSNPDVVRFTLISTGGVSGSLSLANISFQAVGSGGSSTVLAISAITFTDTNGNPIPVNTQNGSIAIPGSPPTNTPVTPSNTPIPPTDTPVPSPTNTSKPAGPTNTPKPGNPTDTPTSTPTNKPAVYTNTNTPGAASSATSTSTSGGKTPTTTPQESATPDNGNEDPGLIKTATETLSTTTIHPNGETPLEGGSVNAPLIPVNIPAGPCGCAEFMVNIVAINASKVTGDIALSNPGLTAEVTSWGCEQETSNLLEALAIWQVNAMVEKGITMEQTLRDAGIQTARDLNSAQSTCVNPATWINAFTRQMISLGYPSNLVVTESPVFPLFVDNSGKMAGFQENGQIVEELPLGVAFELGETRVVWYSGPINTFVVIYGYANGKMNLHTTLVGQLPRQTISFYDIEVKKGMVAILDPADSEHNLLIDDDKDGTANRVIESYTNAEETSQIETDDHPENTRRTITIIVLLGALMLGLVALGFLGRMILNRQLTDSPQISSNPDNDRTNN